MSEEKYTIEVEQTDYGDDIGFRDLKLFHRECLGGKIKLERSHYAWHFECEKCQKKASVTLSYALPEGLRRVSVNGEEMSFDKGQLIITPKK